MKLKICCLLDLKIAISFILVLFFLSLSVTHIKAGITLVGPYSYVEEVTHDTIGEVIAHYSPLNVTHQYSIATQGSSGQTGDWWCIGLNIDGDPHNTGGAGFCDYTGSTYNYQFTPGGQYQYIMVETGYSADSEVHGISLHDDTASTYVDFLTGTESTSPSPTPTPSPTSSPTPAITPTPSPTPSPTETPTPTPSATPTPTPTLTPVTKTVFVPGFGASWNADALLKCKPNNDPNSWSLASYAETIYNPILTALSDSRWTVKPFYYDWRSEIPTNSSSLVTSINDFAKGGEKVNVIGHSMGGLIASDYLINKDQGTKTNSLLAIGAPFNGAVQSYPPWAGGDIWEDNFVTKVAMTLYLRHCGGILSDNLNTIHTYIPSVRNLLPRASYLLDGKTKILIDINTMHNINKNNWSLNLTNFPNIKLGTLTGYGFSTLSQIQTKLATAKEVKSGYWLDGKSSGKIYSTLGDGTVLLSSSTISSVPNVSINQTHEGLVDSSDGMAEILKFLGNSPTISASTTIEPNSALIIIGYPSTFWVADQNGNVKKDKDGMVAFINPKSGNFKLNLIPKSNNTSLIVAQFLPNGGVKYKEYNFKTFAPLFKNVKFDLKNPQDDILSP